MLISRSSTLRPLRLRSHIISQQPTRILYSSPLFSQNVMGELQSNVGYFSSYSTPSVGTQETTVDGNPLRKLTREQVRHHNSPQDCWVIVNQKVYNISSWVDVHPGGRKVLWEHAGEDATDRWLQAGHTARARALMEQYLIGFVEEKKRYSGYTAPEEELDDSNFDLHEFREEKDLDEGTQKWRGGSS